MNCAVQIMALSTEMGVFGYDANCAVPITVQLIIYIVLRAIIFTEKSILSQL